MKTSISNQSVLPAFKGFYGTFFDPDYIQEQTDFLFDDEQLNEIDLNDGESIEAYKKMVGEKSTEIVEYNVNKFLDTKFKFTFQEIWSPKEYNFSNDKIHIQIDFTKNDFDTLIEYVQKNMTQFKEFLKDNFTSRSGFFSFHSNDVDVWLKEYIPTILINEESEYLGFLLEFVCQNENYDDGNLYDDMNILSILF
jgi:hypothetical protein